MKPGNVIVTKSGYKLVDFGLAKIPGEREDGSLDPSGVTAQKPLTRKGVILGTLHYMSPEQLEAKEVDARADVFAFGAMLYEMVTGRRAFREKAKRA